MGDNLDIRPEEPGDREAVRRVNEAAFDTATEADLVDALRASGDAVPELCLVAVEAGTWSGHICFSRARSSDGGTATGDPGPRARWQSSRPRQRRGIGSELVREALERANATELPAGRRARPPRLLPALRLRPGRAYGVECPYDGVPPEAWMAQPLAAYEPGIERHRGLRRGVRLALSLTTMRPPCSST